jgi:cytokinin dehydrogenase
MASEKRWEDLRNGLEGDLWTEPEALGPCARDFGGLLRRTPGAVLHPASAGDVARAVRWARREGVPLAVQGAGHSQSGQSLTDGGLLLDLKPRMGRLLSVDGEAALVEAGALWRGVVARLAPRGLVPPVLTNNLSTAVGGTLGTGGLGVASWRHGTQADNVDWLEVVTGAGEVLSCSPAENADVFDAARGTLGQFGIVTRARLRLRPARPRARTLHLLYDDLDALLRDERRLMESEAADHLESWCTPLPQGFRQTAAGPRPFSAWFYPLQATVELGPGEPDRDAAVLDGLRPYRVQHAEERDLLAFANRLEPLFALWKESGTWEWAHPWMEATLPWSTTAPCIRALLEEVPPQFLVGGHVLLWPGRRDASRLPYFMVPNEPFVMGFGILPAVPPPRVERVLPLLDRASDATIRAGGKRYLSGCVRFDEARWKAHFGGAWARLAELKRRLDPDGILGPGFIPWGA